MAKVKPADERQRLTTEARREHILDAARSVFLRYGYSGSRTKTIAQFAGVSEALVYSHFESKDRLFEAAVLEPLEEMVSGLVDVCNRLPALGGGERREASVQIHTRVLTSMQEIAPLLGVALFSESSFAKVFYREQLKPLLDQIRAAMAASLEGWPHQSMDAGVLTAILLGTYNWIALESTFDSSEVDVAHIANELTNVLVRALDKGPGQ